MCPLLPGAAMSVTLSSAELEALARATETLLSPLNYAHVDGWRSAVNGELKTLLHADSAGFLLPVPDGLLLYSEEHDPAELNKYQEVVPPDMPDGTPLWAQMARAGVTTLANLYGRHYDVYLNSAYYNEYAGANRAHDTLAAAVSAGGVEARSMAILHVWHERPDGRLFGDKETALLRLLFPAFRAGTEMQLRWSGLRADLLNALDGLGQAVRVCTLTGATMHETPTLAELLQADQEPDALRAQLTSVADGVRRAVLAAGHGAAGAPLGPVVRPVHTATARYLARGSLYGGPPLGSTAFVLVGLERVSPAEPNEELVRETYGLTPAEVRVAMLVSQGKSNAAIARELFISPHTARRHTERVREKLNVQSRAQVGAKLLDLSAR